MSTDLKKPDDAPEAGSAPGGAPSDDAGIGGVSASPQPEAAPAAEEAASGADENARVVRRFGTAAEVVELPDSARDGEKNGEASADADDGLRSEHGKADDDDGFQDGRGEDDGEAVEDEDGAERMPAHPDSRPGPAESLFSAFSGGGMLSLFVFACLFFWPATGSDGFYCEGEAWTAHLFHRTMDAAWLTPMADGEILPPLMHWALKGLRALLVMGDLPETMLYPSYGILAAATALIGVWALARAAGFGARAGLAAGLMLLITPLFLVTGNMLHKDVLATGLMLISLAGFCWGWIQERALLSMLLGFVGALAAAMAGGFEFLLVPVATSLIFLIRRMRFDRAQRWDAVLSFFVFLSLIGAWISAIILIGGDKGYASAFSAFFFGAAPGLPVDLTRFLPEIPHVAPRVLHFVVITLLALLPWLILPVFVSWNRAIYDAWQNAKHGEIRPGFLRTALVVTLLVQFFRPGIMLLAFTAMIMPFFARALLRLSPLGSKMLHGLISLAILIAGVFVALISFDMLADVLPPECVAWFSGALRTDLVGMASLPVVAGLCLLTTVIMLKFTRKAFPAGALLTLTLLMMLLSLSVRLLVLPEAHRLLPGVHAATVVAPDAPVPATKRKPAAPAPEARREEAPAPAPAAAPEAEKAEEKAPAPASAPEARREESPAPAPAAAPEAKKAEEKAPAPAPAPEARREEAPAPASAAAPEAKKEEEKAPAPAPAPEARREEAPAPAPAAAPEAEKAEEKAPAVGEVKAAPQWDVIGPLMRLVERIQSNISK